MSIKAKSEAARSVAGTSLTTSLAAVGSATAAPGRIVIMMNGCDAPVTVSWDGGVTSGFILPATSSISMNLAANKTENGQTPLLPEGSVFQAKHNGAAPTTGSLSIMVIT